MRLLPLLYESIPREVRVAFSAGAVDHLSRQAHSRLTRVSNGHISPGEASRAICNYLLQHPARLYAR